MLYENETFLISYDIKIYKDKAIGTYSKKKKQIKIKNKLIKSYIK